MASRQHGAEHVQFDVDSQPSPHGEGQYFGQNGAMYGVAFSPDGSTSGHNTVQLWG
jgi:hypothetical protein